MSSRTFNLCKRCLLLDAPSSSRAVAGSRSYAAVSAPPSTPAKAPRVYTARKSFLYASYNHLLDTSDSVLVFQHNGLSTKELGKITRAIAGVPLPDGSSDRARLTIARTGILSAVSRARSGDESLFPLLSGPVALLTCPSLSPKYLAGILAAINKALGFRSPAPASIASASNLPVSPRLMLLGGVLERNKYLSAQEIVGATQIPEKSPLYGQLVGLLEMPGAQLAGLLGQAGGGSLLRTLQGREAQLKEE